MTSQDTHAVDSSTHPSPDSALPSSESAHPPIPISTEPGLLSLSNSSTLHRLEQLLIDLQTIQDNHHSNHGQTHTIVQGLERSFRQHIQALNRLWDWGEEHETGALPSFSEWLETPVEPTLTSWPNPDILSGVNALDTHILEQHGWTTNPSWMPHNTVADTGVPPSDTQVPSRKESKAAGESAFQTLLQDLLVQADQCRTFLAQLELLQARSHHTDQTQDRHLQHSEDLLTISSMKSLDSLFQDLETQWSQTASSSPIPRLISAQDTHIWIESQPYHALLTGLSALFEQWHTNHRQGNTAIAPSASLEQEAAITASIAESANITTAPCITLHPKIQGQSLILEWKEVTSGKQAPVMDIKTLQTALSTTDSRLLVEAVPTLLPENDATASSKASNVDVEESHCPPVIIKMPMAPTRVKQLVCRVNNDLYGLSSQHIEQLILPKANQLKMATGGVLMLKWQLNQQEELLRIYPLSQLIQYSNSSSWVDHRHRQRIETTKPENTDGSPGTTASPHPSADLSTLASPQSPQVSLTSPSPILLLQVSQQWVGVMVDEVIVEHLALLRPLGDALAPPPWVQGCSLVHDRQLALSIDLRLLLQKAVGFGL